ncbi:DUF4097 and DUF4098 domain-containing protein YvlB [Staphylococcus epidermidis]|uniref:DUF4097 family beta strand repeat-containing protein n=1 Tax=Staphylococcus epidermidis TaxID=1282 RepID=UPI001BBE5B95|nr:DUF4097 family beta strand repeat-containing protein [Staphylococcus epidermidis]MCG2174003.1 DUF4097 domain-containing protein [Staphylococcus epidermidis]MCG2203738.1 DUF4097 domain-containing protein [Staphylococcus epidermidis]MCG2305524.1 DUF4097 domain-containing protein [Staphylococcus epidermidis]MCK6120935.1 DUF4097 domain-containing protein [Staphylococcus epidermidis]MCO6237621.1 DUF4097 domain-containing protein [Staphylococcus epidermidis]
MKKIAAIIFLIGLSLIIICSVGVYAQNKKLSKDNQYNNQTTNLMKNYDDNTVKSIYVDGKVSDITVKKGKHFSVKSKGNDKNLNVTSKVNNQRWVITERQTSPHINFRIQGKVSNHITITVPKYIKNIDIKTNAGDLNIVGVNSGTGRFDAESGDIKVQKGRYKKVTLHNEDGDIQMKQLDPDIPLRIKNEEGDINLNYKKELHHTQIITRNEEGETDIDHRVLYNSKVENGNNKVKLINENGDIKVK